MARHRPPLLTLGLALIAPLFGCAHGEREGPTEADALANYEPIVIPVREAAPAPSWYEPPDLLLVNERHRFPLRSGTTEARFWCESAETLARAADEGGGPLRTPVSLPRPLPEFVGDLEARSVHEVDDGYVVAAEATAGRTELWWFSRDGQEREFVSALRLVGIAEVGDHIMAVVGSSFANHQYGQVLRLEHHEGHWRARTLSNLGEAARVVHPLDDARFLVVTPESVLAVDSDGEVELLHRGGWVGSMPGTVAVRPSGTIHIGTRSGVVELAPDGDGYRELWFEPRQSTKCR